MYMACVDSLDIEADCGEGDKQTPCATFNALLSLFY
jgi:hypothetical protein